MMKLGFSRDEAEGMSLPDAMAYLDAYAAMNKPPGGKKRYVVRR
jgi:hypothetical protein